jgi:hypothetical protein
MTLARELRLGNWISFNGKPIQLTVANIHQYFSGIVSEKDSIKPIEWNEEILDRMGFNIRRGKITHTEPLRQHEWAEGNLSLCDSEFSLVYSFIGPSTHPKYGQDTIATIQMHGQGEYNEVDLKHVKYVHQIQNIYVDLNNVELLFDLTNPGLTATTKANDTMNGNAEDRI